MRKLWIHDTLETNRCTLRIPTEDDVQSLWELIDDDVSEFMDWEKWTNSDKMQEWIKRIRNNAQQKKSWYASVFLKDHTCIWMFWIPQMNEETENIEIWFWIGKKYWWNWYVPECFEALKKHAFHTLKVETMHLSVDSRNNNCKRVALKAWLSYDGTLKKWTKIKWNLINTQYYSLTKEEYFT